MAVDVLVGFRPDTEEPIDSRFIASNASDRLSLVSFNCYKGLLVFQQDTSELYVCIDPSNPSLESSWNLIDGSESSSTGFPFTGNALITGSLIISGSSQNALGGTLTVSDTIFTDVISAVCLSLFLSFTVTIFPARRASKMNPVEALRYE